MSEDTKATILEVALELFSTKGYNSTSVRDISEAAHVNVASINYHFGSKQKLFQTSVLESIRRFDFEVKKTLTSTSPKDSQEAVWRVYECLLSNPNALLATFRAFMTPGVEFPEPPIKKGDFIGPPGGIYLMEIFQKESDPSVPREAFLWATHHIFSHLLHIAVIRISPFGEQQLASLPFYEESFKKYSLALFTEAVLAKIHDTSVDWEKLDCTF